MSGTSDALETPQGAAATIGGAPAGIGRYRWIICALLFFATTINYLDRQVLGILAAPLQKELHWSESDYGWIATAFTGAYAAGQLIVGGLMDLLGTRIGFSLAVVCWSLAAMGHASARSALGFGVARFALGLSESGNFPAAIKTVAEWYPNTERTFATGVFNSGSNVGAIVAPLVVPWIATRYGWRWAFVITGATGFAWLAAWLAIYRKPEEHPRLSRAERLHIRSDLVEPKVKIPWAKLLRHRQTWAFAAGKFFTDPIWWFFLFWLPKFLDHQYGITLSGIGPPLVVIYFAADLGSIGGGWISSTLIHRGWSVNAGRKTAMLVCALCAVPIMLAAQGLEPLGRRWAHQPGDGCASRLVGQPLHPRLRHVPPSGRRLGGRHRRFRWFGKRYADRHRDRIPVAVDGQLRADLLRGRVGLPDRARGHPRARAGSPTGAGAGGERIGTRREYRIAQVNTEPPGQRGALLESRCGRNGMGKALSWP